MPGFLQTNLPKMSIKSDIKKLWIDFSLILFIVFVVVVAAATASSAVCC